MSSVPLHPALVHVPIGLAVVVPFIALGLALALRRGALPQRAWWVAVVLQGIVLAGALVAFKTGSSEEHAVARVVSEQLVEAHEERAEAFLWCVALTFAMSAAALALPGRAASVFRHAAAVGMIAAAGLALYAGKAGGELVYVHGATRAYLPGALAVPLATEEARGTKFSRHDRARRD